MFLNDKTSMREKVCMFLLEQLNDRVRLEQIYHTLVFAKVVCGPHLTFPGFVIHLLAVVSVYVSMSIQCVHMLSRCSAISGR